MNDRHRDLRAEGRMSQEEYDLRTLAAMNRAKFELGDGGWATVILHAFMWPEEDTALLLDLDEPEDPDAPDLDA